MDTASVIALARKHVADVPAIESSARLCLADAVKLQEAGDLSAAKRRALDSLAYSRGVLDVIYRKAAARVFTTDEGGAS